MHARLASSRFPGMLLLALLVPLVSICGSAGALMASDELDSVLEGFSDSAAPDGAGEEDAVLQGFEDDAETGDVEATDDVLQGFDTEAAPAPTLKHPSLRKRLSVDGHVRLAATVNTAHQAPEAEETDWRGLSRLRGAGRLALDARLPEGWRVYASGNGFYDLAYAINGRDDYTDEVLEDYEAETELGETYVSGSLNRHLDLKAGRQIIAWGKSDNVRITDVLNPLDLRTPGLTDVADLRLPVAATRLDLHGGPWALTGAALHEIRFNKTPAFGSDFYPNTGPPPKETLPDDTLSNTEYGLALTGMFRGWDLALTWADIYNDKGHVEIDPSRPGQLTRKHERTQQVGLAANWALGNWLLKAEGARIEGLRFFNAPGERFGRLDLLVGIEYGGWRDSTLSIEVADRQILHHQERLEAPPDAVDAHEPQLVLRLSRDFLHETLNLGVLASYWGHGAKNGGLQRYTATYDISDAMALRVGFIAYQSGKKGQFQGVGDNDRVLGELTYYF